MNEDMLSKISKDLCPDCSNSMTKSMPFVSNNGRTLPVCDECNVYWEVVNGMPMKVSDAIEIAFDYLEEVNICNRELLDQVS
jgi:hypothetical protein